MKINNRDIFNGKEVKQLINKARHDLLVEVENILELCPVCKGTHGQWIRKSELKTKLGELEK